MMANMRYEERESNGDMKIWLNSDGKSKSQIHQLVDADREAGF